MKVTLLKRALRLLSVGLFSLAPLVSLAPVGAIAGPSGAPAVEPLASINLPIEGWTVVAQAKNFFEPEFGKLGTKVNLVDPGSHQISGAEAALLDRGGLAVAQRMMYPATVHRANGLDASIIWLSSPSSKYRTPIIARVDSPVEKLADLEGKTFASSRVSCGWTAPTEALAKSGVPLDTPIKDGKVRFLNTSTFAAASAALLAGRIDATATHVALPDAAALLKSGEVEIIGRTPEGGVYESAAGRVSYFAMREFIDAYPRHIQAILKVRARTDAWIKDHIDEAAAIIARETRIPVDIAKFGIIDESSFQYMDGEPSAAEAVKAVKTFQQWYIDNGDEILKSRHLSDETIETLIDKRFFKGGEYSIYEN